MDWSERLLELLRILLSAAPLAALVALLYRSAIMKFLHQRDLRISWKEGVFETSQVGSNALTERETKEAGPAPAQTAQLPLAKSANAVSPATKSEMAGPSLVPTLEQLQATDQRALWWEYLYLRDKVLVPRTQELLAWLATLPNKMDLKLYDTILSSRKVPQSERAAMIEALTNTHLIQVDHQGNGLITVTPKGLDFLQWRAGQATG